MFSRLGLAFRAFWQVLSNEPTAHRVQTALSGEALPPAEAEKPTEPAQPTRSDALSLLAVLQREARFVDFIQESLEGATDAQVRAAVNVVHRDCAKVLERIFALQPLIDQEEETAIEVPKGFDAAKYRLTGEVSGDPPYQGTLIHPGWKATKCEVPTWTGSQDSAMVVAACEVEVGR